MIEVRGIESTWRKLAHVEAVARDVADSLVAEAADRACDYAKEFVPIDEENLQDAIVVERRGPMHYAVVIDESYEGTRAKNVGQYAFAMHEGIGYSGIARAGWPRGAQFMTRAAEATRDEMDAAVASAEQTIVASFYDNVMSLVKRVFRFFGL